MCETRDLWEGTVQEELVRSDLRQANGEEYPHGDRRQELVFIGVGLKHAAIQVSQHQSIKSFRLHVLCTRIVFCT